jgi:hypothetical protein
MTGMVSQFHNKTTVGFPVARDERRLFGFTILQQYNRGFPVVRDERILFGFAILQQYNCVFPCGEK